MTLLIAGLPLFGWPGVHSPPGPKIESATGAAHLLLVLILAGTTRHKTSWRCACSTATRITMTLYLFWTKGTYTTPSAVPYLAGGEMRNKN